MKLFRRRKAERAAPSYSNESVIARIQADAGVDRETARNWFNEMLVFLDLAAGSKHLISPPEPVDAAWHAFILHTKDYEAYCRERFGRVIHHEPSGSPDPAAYRRAYERRMQYGPADNAIWAVPIGVAAADGGSIGGDAGGGGGSSCGGGGCGGGGG